MLSKIITAEKAASMVRDHDLLVCAGHMNSCMAEEICVSLEERFLREGHPRGLTLMSASGIGDLGNKGETYRGYEHFTHDGMISRVILGHNGSNYKLMKMEQELKVESYNFPQGIIEKMYRTRAGGDDVLVSKVGLDTFVDPRISGGRTNSVTTSDLVSVVTIAGKEYLAYQVPRIDICLIRGTTADEDGNVTCEDEAAVTDIRAAAMAAKSSGGIVICQVLRTVPAGTMKAKEVVVPGIFVDKIVISEHPDISHRMTQMEFYNPAYLGEKRFPASAAKPLPLDVRKIIARRAMRELALHEPVCLGLGIPEYIGGVAEEEGLAEDLLLVVDTGVIGGAPAARQSFGASFNPSAFIDSPEMFDLYDGGCLFAAAVGFGECDASGSVNASLFKNPDGKEYRPGAGGFTNLTQGARNVIFCGTLTAGGFKARITEGKLDIVREGTEKKFVRKLKQVTFSGPRALRNKQNVLFVLDRCVLKLTSAGLMLIEVAPGIDPEKDIFPYMEFRPLIAEDLRIMDEKIFREGPMGLDGYPSWPDSSVR